MKKRLVLSGCAAALVMAVAAGVAFAELPFSEDGNTINSIAVSAAVLPAAAANAATINVIGCDPASSADETDLQQAINLANNETTHPGADTIHLQAGCTYTYSAPAVSGESDALPAVATRITVEGHGATIAATSDASIRHLLRVSIGGNLTVRNVTLRDAESPAEILSGAAMYNQGTATIDDSFILDNDGTAVENGFNSAMTVLDSTFRNNSTRGAGEGGGIRNHGQLIVDGSI